MQGGVSRGQSKAHLARPIAAVQRLAAWVTQRNGRVVVALFLIALAVRLVNLGGPGYWEDESYTLRVALRDLPGVLADHDQTPPLFVLLLHAWVLVAGTAEGWVRLPSAVFGAAAVAGSYLVATRFAPRRVALAAGLLLACSIPLVNQSQDARAYALFLLLAVASTHALLRLEESANRPRRLRIGAAGAYAVATGLMLWAHPFAWFVLLAHAAQVALTRRVRPWHFAGCVAAAVAAFLPWLPVLVERARIVAQGFWVPPPGLVPMAWGWSYLNGLGAVSVLALVILAVHLATGMPRGSPPESPSPAPPHAWPVRPRRVLVAWVVAVAVVPLALSFAVPFFMPNYAIFAALPLALLFVMALSSLRRPAWRRAASLVLALAVVLQLGAYFALGQPWDSKRQWREAAELVDSTAEPGALALFHVGYCDSSTEDDLQCAYAWYARRADIQQVPFFAGRAVNATSVVELDGLVRGHREVWVLYGYRTEGAPLIPARLALLGYEAAGAWHFKHLDVERYTLPRESSSQSMNSDSYVRP